MAKLSVEKALDYLMNLKNIGPNRFLKNYPHPVLLKNYRTESSRSKLAMVVTVSGSEVEEYLSNAARLEDEALLEALVIPLEKRDVNSPEHMLFVGRSPNNDIVVDNEMVSKLHAYFCQVPGSDNYQVVDMNSTNGTFLNGQRLAPSVKKNLENADVLSFGPETRLEFFSSTGFCQLLQRLIE